MSTKVKEGKEEALAHHVLIKILFCDALERNPVRASWEYFIIMSREEEILTHLWIRDEAIMPKDLINIHVSLIYDVELISILVRYSFEDNGS
jgi:hypothetical protein